MEGSSEDPRRGPLRETQELVARGPRVGVNGQGHGVVDGHVRDGRGIRENHVAGSGVFPRGEVGVLAEQPLGEALPRPLGVVGSIGSTGCAGRSCRSVERAGSDEGLFAQDSRDDRATHDRVVAATLDC